MFDINETKKRQIKTERVDWQSDLGLYRLSMSNETKLTIDQLMTLLKEAKKKLKVVEKKKGISYSEVWVDTEETEDEFGRIVSSKIVIMGKRLETDEEYKNRLLVAKCRLRGDIEMSEGRYNYFHNTEEGKKEVEFANS